MVENLSQLHLKLQTYHRLHLRSWAWSMTHYCPYQCILCSTMYTSVFADIFAACDASSVSWRSSKRFLENVSAQWGWQFHRSSQLPCWCRPKDPMTYDHKIQSDASDMLRQSRDALETEILHEMLRCSSFSQGHDNVASLVQQSSEDVASVVFIP